LGETVQERGGELLNGLLASVGGIVNTLLLFVIVPVVAFYLLLDWDNMVAKIDALLPREHAPTVRQLAREIDETLASFIRGQGTVCLILGSFYAVALMLMGLQFGVVVGAVAGLLTFIPYVGALVGGGFGGKEDVTVETYLALLALHTMRPVRLEYTWWAARSGCTLSGCFSRWPPSARCSALSACWSPCRWPRRWAWSCGSSSRATRTARFTGGTRRPMSSIRPRGMTMPSDRPATDPQQLVLSLPVRAALGREDFFVSPSNAVAVSMLTGGTPGGGGKLDGHEPRDAPDQPFARSDRHAPFGSQRHAGQQQGGIAGIDQHGEQHGQPIARGIEPASVLTRRIDIAAKMLEHAGFIQLGMQQRRLHEYEMQQGRDQPRCTTGQNGAGHDFQEHGSVAGKAGGVAHVMRGVMQAIGLDMAGHEHQPEPEKGSAGNRHEAGGAAVGKRAGGCGHCGHLCHVSLAVIPDGWCFRAHGRSPGLRVK
ncbi:hypothetical protein LCGC14_2546450, partial [marine sediment metagenome]